MSDSFTKSFTTGGGNFLNKDKFYVNAPDILYAYPIELTSHNDFFDHFVITTKIGIGENSIKNVILI